VTSEPPEETPGAGPTPDPFPAPEPQPEPVPEGPFVDLSDLRAPAPQVSLISDEDLSWIDKQQQSDEELARRDARKEAHKKKVRRRRRSKKFLKVTGVLLALVLVLGVSWFQWTLGGLERMPAVAGQAGLNTPGTTFLLVAANPEEPDATSVPGSDWKHDLATSDLVMLLHLTRDKRSMYVISIPADSLLPIPGGGQGKLSDAYARGGAKLYVRTIEEFSGVAVDRVATLNMNALREITDQLGGVLLDVPREACNVPAGPRRLDGKQSLEYMALEPCLPRGDLDRVERQQSLLRALMRGAVDGGKVANPFKVQKMLRSTAINLTLEDGFGYPSMFLTLIGMRHLRTTNTTFLTVPTALRPDVQVGGVRAIRLDPAKDAALFDALRRDRLDQYLTTNKDAVVLR
jgi:LCP family protein required for cell wall assembly